MISNRRAAVLVVLAAALGVASTYLVMRPDDLDVQLQVVEGQVDSVNSDATAVCLTDGECYSAVTVLDPVPQVGDHVQILYGSMPLDMSLDGRTNQVVVLEVS